MDYAQNFPVLRYASNSCKSNSYAPLHTYYACIMLRCATRKYEMKHWFHFVPSSRAQVHVKILCSEVAYAKVERAALTKVPLPIDNFRVS